MLVFFVEEFGDQFIIAGYSVTKRVEKGKISTQKNEYEIYEMLTQPKAWKNWRYCGT